MCLRKHQQLLVINVRLIYFETRNFILHKSRKNPFVNFINCGFYLSIGPKINAAIIYFDKMNIIKDNFNFKMEKKLL